MLLPHPYTAEREKEKKRKKKTEDTCSTEKFRLIWYSAIDKAKVS